MRKRPDLASELAGIGLFAPFVVATRLQMLSAELLRPTPRGRRETVRMTAEKPIAMMEGALAVQAKAFQAWLKLCSDAAHAGSALALAAPAVAAAPVRKRVRANARRLGRR
jgi:hypothetical protein